MGRRVRVGLAVLVLLLVVAVLVPALVPADRWKQLALERIEGATGLEVEAASASLSFPWPIGLRLEGLQVRDPNKVSGMDDLAADVRSALVQVEFGPLLRGEFQASSIAVDHVDLQWKDPDGVLHRVADVSARGTATAVAESSTVELAELKLLGVAAEGEVHWRSSEKRATVVLDVRTRLEEAIRALRSAALLRDADVATSNLASLAGAANARLLADLHAPTAGSWTLEARLVDGRTSELVYELPEDGGRVAGEPTWSAQLRTDATMSASATPVDVHYEVDPSGVALTLPEWREPLRATAGRVSGSLNEVRVRDLAFEGAGLEGGTADLRTVDLLGEPHTTGEFHAARLDVGKWQYASGLKSELQSTWMLESLAGNCEVLGTTVRLRDTRAQTADGELRGDVDLDFGAEPPTWRAKADGGTFVAQPLLAPVAPALAHALEALLRGDLEFAGVVAEDPAISLASLTGTAHFVCDDGTLSTSPILGDEVARFLGPNAERWERLSFADLSAALRVEDGRVGFDRVVLRGDFEVALSGSIGLDGSNDYRLDIRLPAGIDPQLGALAPLADLLRDDEGRFAFGVHVGGRASRPEVEIDFADLEARAKKAGEDRAKDRIGDALEGLGDKLFGGKKQ